MRAYGKIETAFWQNPKVRALSEDGRTLLLYILTCPHGNSLGCFPLPSGYATADLGWTSERVSERVSELVSKRFIEHDEPTSIVRIIGWWGHNTIENGKVALGAIRTLRSLPRRPVIENTIKDLNALGNKFLNGLLNEFANAYPNAFRYPEPSLSLSLTRAKPEPSEPETRSPPSEPSPPDAAAPRCASPPVDPAVVFIQAFDAALVEVWGAERRRPWPKADDVVYARRWHEAGLDAALATTMFRDGQAGKLKSGKQPITGLKWFDERVVELLNSKPATPLRKVATPQQIAEAKARAESNATAKLAEHRG